MAAIALWLARLAGAFTVLDRFPGYFGADLANTLYIAATLVAAAVLIGELRSGAERGADRAPGGVERVRQLRGIATAGPG